MSPSPRDSIIERGTDPNATEDAIQTLVFLRFGDYFRATGDTRIPYIYAVPNGGDRNKVSAGVMVATGTKRGIWDIALPFHSGRFPFGAIEMKRPKYRKAKDGGLKPEQVAYGKHLITQGAFFAVCYSADEAMLALTKFLKGESYYA